jgi:hypothetical protein
MKIFSQVEVSWDIKEQIVLLFIIRDTKAILISQAVTITETLHKISC